jgi:two-component system cell cycle sensor histidine kinase/response regulator CckA
MNKLINILMVEDSREDAELIEYEIKKSELNYRMYRVETMQQFRNALEESPPDIILSDFNLQTFKAPDLLEITSKSYSDIPVIVVSGAIGEETAVELLKKGVTDYILKQNLTRLNPSIKRALKDADENKLRIHMNKKLIENSEHIAQIEKLESIGQLAGGIAHDFNNYLQVILGHASMCQVKEITKENMIYSMKEISNMATKAGILTKQLLLFSRRQNMQPISININDTIQVIAKMLFRLLGENIEIDTTLEGNLNNIYADPIQMEQVIINICVNARDAMPSGGQLHISTKEVNIHGDFNEKFPWIKTGQYIKLAISDTGMGITDDVKTRLFEPFFTTKEEGKGTGMGLATVYGIVKQHKGFIDIESKINSGSVFNIYLPVSPTQISETEKQNQLSVEGRGKTILFIEDNEDILMVVTEQFKRTGFKVITATNGRDALTAFNAEAANIDLVLTDVILPKMSGIKMYTKIQQTQYSVPFLFVSGFDEDNPEVKEILDKGLPFIMKPYSYLELLEKINTLLTPSDIVNSGLTHQRSDMEDRHEK